MLNCIYFVILFNLEHCFPCPKWWVCFHTSLFTFVLNFIVLYMYKMYIGDITQYPEYEWLINIYMYMCTHSSVKREKIIKTLVVDELHVQDFYGTTSNLHLYLFLKFGNKDTTWVWPTIINFLWLITWLSIFSFWGKTYFDTKQTC